MTRTHIEITSSGEGTTVAGNEARLTPLELTDAHDPLLSLVPLGRLLLVAIFLTSGMGQIAGFTATAEMMTRKGIPASSFLLTGAIAFELVGGLSVLLGFKARFGAILLMAFLIPVTPIFHDFWNLQGMERMGQQTHFAKNVAIFGALLVIAVRGAGPFSLDRRSNGRRPRPNQQGG